MQKSSINPANLQQLLESTPNALAKGQAQWFTPGVWAQALSQALPRFRPVVVDLTCGNGQLLAGAERPSTNHLLGCDIDPSSVSSTSPLRGERAGSARPSAAPAGVRGGALRTANFINADLCKLYPLLHAAKFEADCFVLNPPWDHHWNRDQLALLAGSDLATGRAAFSAHDGRTGRDTIDSTVATLCMALDLCSTAGEGFIIANEATLQRLIFADDAPHAALAVHIWAHLIIPGNICCPESALRPPPSEFNTGVLYFARRHDTGPHPEAVVTLPAVLNSNPQPVPLMVKVVANTCAELHRRRLVFRNGAEIKTYNHTDVTSGLWRAAAAEWERLNPTINTQPSTKYNLWLHPNGAIVTNLSLFDEATGRVDKPQAEALFALNGKQPLQLVMLRESRRALLRAVQGHGPWRVDPRLNQAVTEALAQYEKVRAPLYPLSPIQRLGYLDEQDFITCRRDLFLNDGGAKLPRSPDISPPHSAFRIPHFHADQTYALRSATVAVQRVGEKPNLTGGVDACEWNGQELAFFITDATGAERVFMEGRLRSKDVRISLLRPGEKPGRQDENSLQTCGIDYTLHELVDHFEIPDVPDVARVNPAGYQRHLGLLKEIEQLCQS